MDTVVGMVVDTVADKAVDMVVGMVVDKGMADYYNNYFCHLTKKGAVIIAAPAKSGSQRRVWF